MANFDVIVVGAGCAGPAAAKKAAELGLQTLLVEKAIKPGEKNVSGTCLNAAALSDSDLHYLLDGPVEREIREMRTYHIAADRTTVFHEIPAQGILLLSIRRDEFDAWHTEQARAAGADVHLGSAVVDIIESDGRISGVRTDAGQTHSAQVVIDAGGVNSIVGRRAGLIPKRDVVTLGTGGYMDDHLITPEFPSVNTYMQNFLDLPVVQDKLAGGRIAAWGLHLEFDEVLDKRVRDGLILTGEAGGFVAPFLGEGMPEAFFTGIYAAQAAAEAIQSGDVSADKLETSYNDQIEANIFMQAFRYVAAANKEAILSMEDGDIVRMMQNVVMGGGFITNVLHNKWMRGAENDDLEMVKEAYDFLDFVQPYREIGNDFEEIYRERRKK